MAPVFCARKLAVALDAILHMHGSSAVKARQFTAAGSKLCYPTLPISYGVGEETIMHATQSHWRGCCCCAPLQCGAPNHGTSPCLVAPRDVTSSPVDMSLSVFYNSCTRHRVAAEGWPKALAADSEEQL